MRAFYLPILCHTPMAQERHEFVIPECHMESGATLPKARVVYGTYGRLNAEDLRSLLGALGFTERIRGDHPRAQPDVGELTVVLNVERTELRVVGDDENDFAVRRLEGHVGQRLSVLDNGHTLQSGPLFASR